MSCVCACVLVVFVRLMGECVLEEGETHVTVSLKCLVLLFGSFFVGAKKLVGSCLLVKDVGPL